jgi:outer membrane protein assembly factor BamE (lipoprotein component of BamABCDE complex)
MVTRLAIAVIISLVTSFSSYAHDSDRIEQLEKDAQKTKQRLSILESKLQNKNAVKGHVITGDGWESIANWRKLTTGMNTSAVQKILGEPQRVEGGNIARWYYENGGRVMFYEGKLDGWSEPP